jgi:hypothetical protein
LAVLKVGNEGFQFLEELLRSGHRKDAHLLVFLEGPNAFENVIADLPDSLRRFLLIFQTLHEPRDQAMVVLHFPALLF